MIIAADRNIPFIDAGCAHLGEVRLYDSADRAALRTALDGADALLCRSTIRVDAALLEHARVGFVATATSGVEHVDVDWLAARGIGFASAAGSNALSVAEYVFAALLRLGCRDGWDLRSKSIGIIGVGHVGTWVELIAHRMGMDTVCCDPPLHAWTGSDRYRDMEEALACDIVTLHVPLTGDGPHPTRGLIGAAALDGMRTGAILINSARGGVMEMEVVRQARRAGRIGALVLDVLPGEPAIAADDIAAADIVTPHIAGHSHDGKLLGTQMVYEALCRYLHVEPTWNHLDALDTPEPIGCISPCNQSDMQETEMIVRQVWDIRDDDAFMRRIAGLGDAERGRAFAQRRSAYPIRREFAAHTLDRLPCSPGAEAMVLALGFRQA